MYEPIRTKSVHSTMAGTTSDFPHRSREEELDIQLAGDLAAERLAEQVARLRSGHTPARATGTGPGPRSAALHERAHTLAGRALVVAASRADTAVAILSAERMDAHTAALADPKELSAAH
jgi:hypothetical protein